MLLPVSFLAVSNSLVFVNCKKSIFRILQILLTAGFVIYYEIYSHSFTQWWFTITVSILKFILVSAQFLFGLVVFWLYVLCLSLQVSSYIVTWPGILGAVAVFVILILFKVVTFS